VNPARSALPLAPWRGLGYDDVQVLVTPQQRLPAPLSRFFCVPTGLLLWGMGLTARLAAHLLMGYEHPPPSAFVSTGQSLDQQEHPA